MVAKRVAEELERRKDEIEMEVLRRWGVVYGCLMDSFSRVRTDSANSLIQELLVDRSLHVCAFNFRLHVCHLPLYRLG